MVVQLNAISKTFHIWENTERVPAEVNVELRVHNISWAIELFYHPLSQIQEQLLYKLLIFRYKESVKPKLLPLTFFRFYVFFFGSLVEISRSLDTKK